MRHRTACVWGIWGMCVGHGACGACMWQPSSWDIQPQRSSTLPMHKALSINIHLSQFCESAHMLCLMVLCSCSHGQGLVWWWWRPSSMAAKPQRACTLPMHIASSMLICGSFIRMRTCFASWLVALVLLTKT